LPEFEDGVIEVDEDEDGAAAFPGLGPGLGPGLDEPELERERNESEICTS